MSRDLPFLLTAVAERTGQHPDVAVLFYPSRRRLLRVLQAMRDVVALHESGGDVRGLILEEDQLETVDAEVFSRRRGPLDAAYRRIEEAETSAVLLAREAVGDLSQHHLPLDLRPHVEVQRARFRIAYTDRFASPWIAQSLIYEALLWSEPDDALAGWFADLAAADPERALQLLKLGVRVFGAVDARRTLQEIVPLSSLLVPLLEHEDRTVRERAGLLVAPTG